MKSSWALLGFLVALCSQLSCGNSDSNASSDNRAAPTGGSSTGGTLNATCKAASSTGAVQKPSLWKNIPGETSWYASPIVMDLDKDGKNEIIAAYYTLSVLDNTGAKLDESKGASRVYPPHVVADLEGDGIADIVIGRGNLVEAFEWKNGKLATKAGWPADTTSGGNKPEVRGLAAGDLDGNGSIEIVATTTQTAKTEDGGAQVFVYNANGTTYQPPGITWNAWPRYNSAQGTGNDADGNGQGHSGYGCYGLNVGIGNIDDTPDLEVFVTYDNHHIQAFKKDGVAIDSSPWFTNPSSKYLNQRLTWGQFIRWADPAIEQAHYHDHTDYWPDPGAGNEWLQWTASPPNVVDLDLDGKNEVLGVPNVEKNDPYVTQAYALMVLEGDYADHSRSAMRKAGWEVLPRGASPVQVDDYPPAGIPATATTNIQGDSAPEIVVSLNDYFMHAFTADGKELWKYNYSHGKGVMFASEPAVADLNQDGSPEIVFTTYGAPDELDSGNLLVLAADGKMLFDIPLPNQGDKNGNGNGAPAAPTIADVNGDGQLEILMQTFEHGMDIFTVPGSATNCLLWSTSRGGPLRMGQPNKN
jgi:hypothetical protein